MRFALVHGAFHGAWCWERLIPELRALGHDAIAMDLPGHGARRAEASTLTGYREAVLQVLRPGDVLVGHSMGCVVATLAADAFPDLRGITYIAGPLPVDGRPLTEEMGGGRGENGAATVSRVEDGADQYLRISEDGQFFSLGFEGAVDGFLHDCDEGVAAWAFDHLTPQHIGVLVSEPVRTTGIGLARVPPTYIRCTQDRVFPRELSDRQIAKLGVTPFEIDSSHSPFLSRPAELARLLIRCVDTSTSTRGELSGTGIKK